MDKLFTFLRRLFNSRSFTKTLVPQSTFKKAFEKVVTLEGNYSNHPDDTGGETMYGITIKVARKNKYTGAMKNMPLDVAETIYLKNYWLKNSLDKIEEYAPEIAIELFESGVNCGIFRAAKWLQIALNALNRNSLYKGLKADGKIGNKTISAFDALPRKDYTVLCKILNILQGQHYLNILKRNKSQKVFIRGWLKRVTFCGKTTKCKTKE